MSRCAGPKCRRQAVARGLCHPHWQQRKVRGDEALLTPLVLHGASRVVLLDDHAEVVLFGKDGSEAGRALVDLADVPLVKQYRWGPRPGSTTTYAYGRLPGGKARVHLHRLLTGAPAGTEVDHVNGNGLDNRRVNLKVVTHKGNGENQRVRTNNTSGYRGVHRDNRRGRWVAAVMHNGRSHFLGYFDDVEDAARAAHEGRERLFTNHNTRAATSG